jgi:hypothetical protein
MPAQTREDVGSEIGAEGVCRVLRECMGLVDDHEIVIGEHVAARGEVHAVERVVDHEDRNFVRPPARQLGEALGAVGTVSAARALQARAADGGPRRVGDRFGERGPVTDRRRAGQLGEVLHVRGERGGHGGLEQRVGFGGGTQLRAAQVIGAPFQQRERERNRAVLRDRREILLHELTLKRDRRRRDHDLEARRDRGGQVGEALPRTGRCLGNEMMTFGDRGRDGRRELTLTVPVLAAEPDDGRVEERERIGSPRSMRSEITSRH